MSKRSRTGLMDIAGRCGLPGVLDAEEEKGGVVWEDEGEVVDAMNGVFVGGSRRIGVGLLKMESEGMISIPGVLDI